MWSSSPSLPSRARFQLLFALLRKGFQLSGSWNGMKLGAFSPFFLSLGRLVLGLESFFSELFGRRLSLKLCFKKWEIAVALLLLFLVKWQFLKLWEVSVFGFDCYKNIGKLLYKFFLTNLRIQLKSESFDNFMCFYLCKCVLNKSFLKYSILTTSMKLCNRNNILKSHMLI